MVRSLAILVVLLATYCPAAVIYLPVQYQFGQGADRYYYGGSNPAIAARAARSVASRQFHRGPTVTQTPTIVYSDAFPHQPNAAVYGVTPSDARNEAYNAVPRYFRMTDLLLNAAIQPDGTILVPPTTPGTIDIRPYVRPVIIPRPILIIPRRLLQPPATVANATVRPQRWW